MSIRTRTIADKDAEQVVSLYREFTQYLRALGDTIEAGLTADIFRRD